MKKVLKNISRVLFSLLLIVSIFGAFNVFAADVIFQITGISVKEKSDKVTVNDVSLSGGSIVNDIIFTDQGDYITYDITIKNVTEDDYTIKSITDDNTSAYLEYTYDDLSNVKVNKGESKTFNLTITYKQETNDLTISDQAVSLTLTYEKEDGTTGTETITNDDDNGTITPDDTNTTGEVKGATITNPKTGDNITIYIILGLVSLTGLVITTVSKKHLQKSLMVIALVSIVAIPLGVKADSESFKISFTTNKIQNSYAELVTGQEFNLKIYELVLGEENMRIECYSSYNDYDNGVCNKYTSDNREYNWLSDEDRDPKHIKRATDEEYELVKGNLTEHNLISLESSKFPIYMWYEDNTIYYYSIAKTLFMNEDSGHMFQSLRTVESIDLETFNTSRVQNFQRMFDEAESLKSLDLSNFDTSKATDMSGMFAYTSSLETLDLSSFDTSNVYEMFAMFDCSGVTDLNISSFDTTSLEDAGFMFSGLYLETLDLSHFKTPNLTNMRAMFGYMGEIKSLDLSSFDTSKVINMQNLFAQIYSVEVIDISSFDTSNVEDMSGMFICDENLKTIYVSNTFNIDSNAEADYMFDDNYLLKGGAGTEYNYMHRDGEYARIDDPSNGKPGYFTLKQN